MALAPAVRFFRIAFMTRPNFHAGPAAASQILSDLQAADAGPVAWTRQPVADAIQGAIAEQVAALKQTLDLLILRPESLAPLTSLVAALPPELLTLTFRTSWQADAVYWPSSLDQLSPPALPGDGLTPTLRTGKLRFAFATIPTNEQPFAGWQGALPLLAPRQSESSELRQAIANAELPDGPDGVALRAGLYQLHDFLDESHQCSQSIEGRGLHHAGDYWHAIMHRREPDYGNSKYWFRHVGPHPIFAELAPLAREFAPPANFDRWSGRLWTTRGWDPFAFVDLCEAAAQSNDPALAEFAQRVQWAEMLLLLASTARDAGVRR